jgi:hypothetical protein
MTAIRMAFSTQGKALLIISLFAVAVSAGVIPLTVDTGAAVAQYPLSTGIPFPRGELTSLDNVKLTTVAQVECPAQYTGLCKWPDGSLKSVLVTFKSDISPSSTTAYNLYYGTGTTRSAYATPLTYSEDNAGITVTTGPVRFKVSKTAFDVFDQVYIDENKNGTFEESEKIIDKGGYIFFNNAADNVAYKSSLYAKPVCVIEESGPVRIVLKITGKLQSAAGTTMTDFIVWIYAYAEKEQVKVEYTLVDTREDPDVANPSKILPVCAKSYGIYLPHSVSGGAYTFGGENNQTYTGPAAGRHYLYQHGSFNHVDGDMQPFTLAYEGAGTGAKAPGWLDVSGAVCGIGVAVRNFWQQFPKEFSVDDSSLTVFLHPEHASAPTPDVSYPALTGTAYIRPNTFYFPQYGGAKTYQVIFSFHAGNADAAQIASLNKNFQATYPLAMAPASWYTGSKAFGDLSISDTTSAPYDRNLMNNIYMPSSTDRNQSLLFIYGWRDFGDRLRPGWCDVSAGGTRIPGFYNDTHVGAMGFFHQYLRTMDKRWYELAEIATRHFMDIDVAHCNRKGYWSAGNLGPGEGHLSKHEIADHADRNIHFGHSHVSGLPDYYLLTGDKRAYDVMREMGDWWANMSPLAFPSSVDSMHSAEAERDYGWPLFAMEEVFRGTGDVKYLQAAAQEVRHLLAWWKVPSNHYVNGTIVGRNDYRQGNGWWFMYPRCDNSPMSPSYDPATNPWAILYNGTNPWMAGPLLSNLSKFREYDADYKLVNDDEVKEMTMQATNYVVKYGWNETKQNFPYNYFVYCEATPSTDGGMDHLVYPVLYACNEFNKGGFAHPEWYSTALKWSSIATTEFDQANARALTSTTQLGFYGYEITYPLDYFALRNQMHASAVPVPRPQVNRGAGLTQLHNGLLFEGSGSREGMAKMLICNSRGQVVAAFTTQEHAGAPLHLQWNGVNARGARVPRGIYIATISAGSIHSAKSIVISR